jgi:arsenate reductase
MSVKIFHNPRCSKSRKTLELLRERGVEPEIVEYLKTPPSAAELDRVLTLLGKQPREVLRTEEAAYAAAGLDDMRLGRAELIARMVENPSVLQRPIVVAGERAALGRPPEDVLALLDES